jgi:hypothetical protein
MSNAECRMRIEIRRNADGLVRVYETDPGTFGGYHEYVWTEGNFSCDCNRRLLFARAAGDDEDWESDCSEHLYDVRITNADTGEVLLDEFARGEGLQIEELMQ